jgi:hypothetical protein
MFPQNRQRNVRVIRISIIESDTCGAWRQLSFVESPHRLKEGDDVEAGSKLPDLLIEPFHIAFIREQSIQVRQYTMKYQYG